MSKKEIKKEIKELENRIVCENKTNCDMRKQNIGWCLCCAKGKKRAN